jgi:hypothetical protein
VTRQEHLVLDAEPARAADETAALPFSFEKRVALNKLLRNVAPVILLIKG